MITEGEECNYALKRNATHTIDFFTVLVNTCLETSSSHFVSPRSPLYSKRRRMNVVEIVLGDELIATRVVRRTERGIFTWTAEVHGVERRRQASSCRCRVLEQGWIAMHPACMMQPPCDRDGSSKTCRDPGSNQGPSDLQSNALPTELSRRMRVYH